MARRARLFRALARFVVGRPVLVLAAVGLVSVLAVLYSRARLEFRTGQDDLISGASRDSRNYLRYTREFPDLDGALIVVRAGANPGNAERFADALAKRLGADRANVKSLFYRVDPGLFSGRALLYLSRGDLLALAQRIRAHRDFLSRYSAAPTLATFFRLVNGEVDRAMAPEMTAGMAGMTGRRPPAAGPAGSEKPAALDLGMPTGMLTRVLEGMLAPRGGRFASPWEMFTGTDGQGGGLRDGYLASDSGKYLLIHVAPGDGVAGGPDPVGMIERELGQVRARFPGVEAGMTGGPALARAEENSTAHDIALASALAIASNVLLVVIPFGGLVEPAFALAALLAGVAWSFGFTTLAVGHLNLLSAVFTSILAGIGINFSIHLMARYDEARRQGLAMPRAVELAVVNTGAGVVASACIMALAFLMPMFTDFKGIAELGLISAAGLFLCLVSALLVFPALVAIRDRNRPPSPRLHRVDGRKESRLAPLFRRPWLILAAAAALTLGALVLAPRVRFDQNLLKLQAAGTEAVRFEGALLKDSGRSSWFAVSLAKSRAEAERMARRFRRLPEVARAETVATYIPGAQPEKRAILAGIRRMVEPIRMARPGSSGSAPALERELGALRSKLDSAAPSDSSGALAHAAALLGRVIGKLRGDTDAFAPYERALASDLGAKLGQLNAELSPGEVSERSLPKVLHDRFIGSSGAYLVQVYPRGDVWADAPLARFVAALRTVDPDATGPPVQTYSMAAVMRRGYERAAVLAIIAVFIFVFTDFRSLRDTVLATTPLLFGGAWLLGAMGALGWEFNLANLFAIPIIIGTAVDNGVNMLYRWREERDQSELILTKAVGKSVTISSLTTIAGFAALIPASHRGISSLGWVLSLGVGLILAATVLVLPALFEVIGRKAGGSPQIDRRTVPEKPRRAAGTGLGMLAIGALLAATAPDPAGARANPSAWRGHHASATPTTPGPKLPDLEAPGGSAA